MKQTPKYNYHSLPESVKRLVQSGDPSTFEDGREGRDFFLIKTFIQYGALRTDVYEIFKSPTSACGDKFREEGDPYFNRMWKKVDKAIKAELSPRKSKAWKFDAAEYSQKVKSKYKLAYKHGEGFREYDPRGVWMPRSDTHINSIIRTELAEHETTFYANEVFNKLKHDPEILLPPDQDYDNHPTLINMVGGMFDPLTGETLPHDQKYFSIFQHPVHVKPDSTPERLLAFLQSSEVDPVDILALQEFAGYLINPVTDSSDWEKLLFMVGPGSGGKGVFGDTMAEMVGWEHVVNIQPRQMTKPFNGIMLKTARLNWVDDCDYQEIEQSGMFKSQISRARMTDAKKYQDGVTFKPKARFIFAGNRLPRVNDRSYGMYRRFLIINFPKKIPDEQQDRFLRKKLKEELDAIFMWAVGGLRRLYENNGFTESEKSQAAVESFRRENNHVLSFIEDKIHLDPLSSVRQDVVFDCYLSWAQASGYKPMPKVWFFKELYTELPQITKDRHREDGKREYFIRGIILF